MTKKGLSRFLGVKADVCTSISMLIIYIHMLTAHKFPKENAIDWKDFAFPLFQASLHVYVFVQGNVADDKIIIMGLAGFNP